MEQGQLPNPHFTAVSVKLRLKATGLLTAGHYAINSVTGSQF